MTEAPKQPLGDEAREARPVDLASATFDVALDNLFAALRTEYFTARPMELGTMVIHRVCEALARGVVGPSGAPVPLDQQRKMVQLAMMAALEQSFEKPMNFKDRNDVKDVLQAMSNARAQAEGKPRDGGIILP